MFNKCSNYVSNKTSKFVNYFNLENNKQGRRKIYSSIWALFFGLLLASFMYYIFTLYHGSQTTTIFSFIKTLFKNASGILTIKLLKFYIIFFIFAGLSVAIGFKSGIFNIGVSGQMMMPSIVMFYILIANRIQLYNIHASFLIGMFFIFILAGMLVGALSGLLKAYFNIHEVISTIFLNWIIVYISNYIFNLNNNVFFPVGTSNEVVTNYLSQVGGTNAISVSQSITNNFIIFGFILAAFLIIAFTFIYNKTTFGYKLKTVGLNKTNSDYIGINKKLTTTLIMAISGALAGLAGFYYYVFIQKSISGAASPSLIGFDAIAVALIALNAPIGIAPVAIIYAFLYSGSTGFQFLIPSEKVSSEFFQVIYGIIIFMAALSMIFYKFRPLNFITKHFYLIIQKKYWLETKQYFIRRKEIKSKIDVSFKLKKQCYINKKEFKKTDKEYENFVYKKIHKSKVNNYTNDQIIEMYELFNTKRRAIEDSKNEKRIYEYDSNKKILKSELLTNKKEYKKICENMYSKFIDKIKSKFLKKTYKETKGEA